MPTTLVEGQETFQAADGEAPVKKRSLDDPDRQTVGGPTRFERLFFGTGQLGAPSRRSAASSRGIRKRAST